MQVDLVTATRVWKAILKAAIPRDKVKVASLEKVSYIYSALYR